ncbi:hypothetical protein EVAR_27333_1 [Eumeta japonica]|uniref:Uncharacterized protein n=1 Tax=Eumeta variegata TaxID=151549 RepID=A0A4C1UCM4_EUMVA|nr:hypothetical protein EVAR_27333_1 [Eumeta japonica]
MALMHVIAGAGWYIKNDVIARDLGVETIEELVRMLARRAFNRADEGPYLSLHNLAPHYDRPAKGYQLLRDLVSKSPVYGKVRHGTVVTTDVRNTSAVALCVQQTLNVAVAARLQRCRWRGACPDVLGTISLNCEPTLQDAPRRLD